MAEHSESTGHYYITVQQEQDPGGKMLQRWISCELSGCDKAESMSPPGREDTACGLK